MQKNIYRYKFKIKLVIYVDNSSDLGYNTVNLQDKYEY